MLESAKENHRSEESKRSAKEPPQVRTLLLCSLIKAVNFFFQLAGVKRSHRGGIDTEGT